MSIREIASRHIEALRIRRRIKKQNRRKGLSTNLKQIVANYRVLSPEYADELEKLIYPPAFSGK